MEQKIISNGRHYNIQLIFLSHLAVDLNPKSRYNVIEITCNNSNQFFKDLKTKSLISYNLKTFNYVKFGIIKYNLNRNTFQVFDKNLKIVYDTETNIEKPTSDFNIAIYIQ